MHSRSDLHSLLCKIAGTVYVYYQPPSGTRMHYPCITYSMHRVNNTNADDMVYKQDYNYTVTVIDKDPDSSLRDAVSRIPTARFDRSYIADNLNHYVFNIYY